MLVKLDENLGRMHADLLSRMGHTADRVHDQGLSGASDEKVWQKVNAEQRSLLRSTSTSPMSASTRSDHIPAFSCCDRAIGAARQ